MTPLQGLSDSLTFTGADSYALTCDDESIPTGEENLITKAVRSFEQASSIQVTYRIQLEKNIPHAAGLGGGSSDAAHTLLALNHLYNEPLTLEKLHEMASDLGSDIPFFLYNAPCMCRGRGEQIEVMPQRKPSHALILKPQFGVSTPSAFKNWKDSKEIKGFSYKDQNGPYGKMNNALERPVFEKYIFLGEMKRWLLAHNKVKVAQMSGSGSTMFALTSSDQDSQDVIADAKQHLDPNLYSWFGMI